MKKVMILAALMAVGATATAQVAVEYQGGLTANWSTDDYAPYFIGALSNGRYVRANGVLADVGAFVRRDDSKKFSWGAGVELMGGVTSSNDYAHYYASTDKWGTTSNDAAPVWIQQLYGEVKYRSLFLRLGQKDYTSALLDESLSSGDLTRSGNARGIPGFEAGFIDFQDIPFTNGWVQIEGVIEYGRFIDDDFDKEQFNYYNYTLTSDVNYTYKRCYFRTKPSENFSVTIGMQTAGQFGGSSWRYTWGTITWEENRGTKFKDFFKMFFPTQGGSDGYYEGNSLGSWDLKARYRLRNGDEISFAFQGPWEDGSGIGRANGTDGLWGLYYHSPKRQIISGAAFEFLDFRNQSGPIHWATHDNPGTTINDEATGGDDYYNNVYYASFSNYGQSIGSPFLLAPFYNANGYSGYAHSRARGVHLALKGYLGEDFEYSVKYSWQQAWGNGRNPQAYCLISNSLGVSASYDAHKILSGLKFNAKAAYDGGSLRGDNFGLLFGISYSGDFSF